MRISDWSSDVCSSDLTLADQDRSPDGTIFLLTPRAPGASPRRLLMQTLSGTKEKRDAISQELRLQSTGDSFLNWAIGGYYSRLNVDSTRRQGGEIITNKIGRAHV